MDAAKFCSEPGVFAGIAARFIGFLLQVSVTGIRYVVVDILHRCFFLVWVRLSIKRLGLTQNRHSGVIPKVVFVGLPCRSVFAIGP